MDKKPEVVSKKIPIFEGHRRKSFHAFEGRICGRPIVLSAFISGPSIPSSVSCVHDRGVVVV